MRAGLTNHSSIKVLHSASLCNVARDAKIEEDVVEVGVPVGLQTAKHNEAAAIVDGLGGLNQPAAQGWERKCCWTDIVRTEVTGEGFSCGGYTLVHSGVSQGRVRCNITNL